MITTFSIPWDCPDCGCGSDSSASSTSPTSDSSTSSDSSASWDGQVRPCGESILTVRVHVVRAADPSIGVDALDAYVDGYVPSAFFTVGETVYNYNNNYIDCTCTISEILYQKCYTSSSSYYSDWNATNINDRWGA